MFKNNSALHRELCSMLCSSLDGKKGWGRIDVSIGVAESLCCPVGIYNYNIVNQQSTTLHIGETLCNCY